MSSTVKTVVFWFVIVLSATLLWQVVKGGNEVAKTPEISYSEFLSQVDAGNVSKVVISRNQVTGTSNSGQFRVIAPSSQDGMLQTLRQKNVEIWFRDSNSEGGWPQWLMNLAPLILLAALWFFMIRQIQQRKQQSNDGGPYPR